MFSNNTRLYFSAALHSAIVLLALFGSNVSAFQTPKPVPAANTAAIAGKAAAAAALAVILSVGTPAFAADGGAAQIMIDQIPPSTVSIQVGDIPVVGSLVSGTYTKLDAKAVKELTSPPSVVISSPKDKFKALKAATTGGHLEFDVGGKVGLKTHLDVDVAADEAGVARIRVASDLIPPLPFKNIASSSYAAGGKTSDWSVVTNMGSGESYYYNTNTGATQYEKPSI
mmetsp:Transcript_13461/g.33871  ORF Transcript_13461/g.33871 Transcript_13461/m.33871 type:complete len:227 (-) Transcript_13461:38-718(-)